MSKLNGPPIALTLWNIVPLTKDFLLTVSTPYTPRGGGGGLKYTMCTHARPQKRKKRVIFRE